MSAAKSVVDGLVSEIESEAKKAASERRKAKGYVTKRPKEKVDKEIRLRENNEIWMRPTWFEMLCHMIEGGFFPCMMGPPATGKTCSADVWAMLHGYNLHIQQGYRDLGVEDVRGSRTLKPDEHGVLTTPVIYGTLVESMIDPRGALLWDEIAATDHGIQILIANVLSGTGSITIPESGEVIYKNHDKRELPWVMMATMNPLYLGTHEIQEAIMSRLWMIDVSYPEEKVEVAMIRNKYPDIPLPVAKGIVAIATALREGRTTGLHSFDCDIRTMYQLAWNFFFTGSLRDSFIDVVLPKIGDAMNEKKKRDACLKSIDVVISGSGF